MSRIFLMLLFTTSFILAKNIIIATGESSGNYYKIGQEINSTLYKNKAKVLKTSGSVENMLLVAKGKADIALVQEDALAMLDIFFKVDGLNKYDLVDIAGYLYTETLHILVNQNSKISQIEQLENKTVSYGSKKSGSSVTASFIEEAYNIHFKQVVDTSIDEGLKLLSQNKIDALFYVTKSPSKLLSKYDNVRLLPANKKIVDNEDIKIRKLSRKTYGFLKKDINAYGVNTVIITTKYSKELPKVKAYLRLKGKTVDQKKSKHHVFQTGSTLHLPQNILDAYVQKYGNRALFRYNYINKHLDKIKQEPKISQKFRGINLMVNKIHFLEDHKHWKKDDYWSTPLEFIGTGIGDSEEFALFKLLLLSKIGIDSNKFKLIEKKTPLKLKDKNHTQNISLAYFHKKKAKPIIFDYIQNSSKIYLYKNSFNYTTIEKTQSKNWNRLLSTKVSKQEIDGIFAYMK